MLVFKRRAGTITILAMPLGVVKSLKRTEAAAYSLHRPPAAACGNSILGVVPGT